MLGTHGVAVPNRTGIFGGLPGACAKFERVGGSGVLEAYAEGRMVDSLAELDGEHTLLPGVSPSAKIRQGDVFECTVQDGGGYGDPLLRAPEQVAADVAERAVSGAAAERLYGVIVDEAGVLDEAATEARRDEIRKQRREKMQAPDDASSGGGSGGGDAQVWGGVLTLSGSGSDLRAACKHCGQSLGSLADGWERLAGRVELGPDDLGEHVRVHADLVTVMYVCPNCQTALWTDTEPKDGRTWRDFALD